MILNDAKLFFIFILGAFFVGPNLYGQEALDHVAWGNITVIQESISEPRNSYSDLPIKAKLTFYKNHRRLYEEKLIHPHKLTILKTKIGDLLAAAGYSGGESGCCDELQVFYRTHRGIKNFYAASTIGYAAAPHISDINDDGIDEIRTDSEKWYRVHITSKGPETCSLDLMPGSYRGMSALRVPIYGIIIKKNDGEASIEDITFSSSIRPYLELEMKKARKTVRKLDKNLIALESPDIGGLLQYLDYETQLGKRAEALDLFKRINFKIHYRCDGQTEEHSESLVNFLNHDWKWSVENPSAH